MRLWPKFLMIVSFLALSQISEAEVTICNCKEKDFDEMRERAFAIFTGTVIEKTLFTNPYHWKIRFKVENSWKVIDNPQVSVFTNADYEIYPYTISGQGCSYEFEMGKKYLVYSYRKRNKRGPSWVNRCGGTKLIEQAVADIKELGKPLYSYDENGRRIIEDLIPDTRPYIGPFQENK